MVPFTVKNGEIKLQPNNPTSQPQGKTGSKTRR